MKTMKKVMLTIMTVMISTMAFANNEKPVVKVERVGAKSVAVIAYHLGEESTQIQLKSNNGKTLYRANVEQGNQFAQRLNLTAIAAGDYTLEIENNSTFTAIPVKMGKDSAFINSADQVTIVKPKICLTGSNLDVLTADISNDVWVSIYNDQNQRIALERISDASMKRFNLSNLNDGNYTVQMATKGRKFVQSVALKK